MLSKRKDKSLVCAGTMNLLAILLGLAFDFSDLTFHNEVMQEWAVVPLHPVPSPPPAILWLIWVPRKQPYNLNTDTRGYSSTNPAGPWVYRWTVGPGITNCIIANNLDKEYWRVQ
jgi:hypothetical protein